MTHFLNLLLRLKTHMKFERIANTDSTDDAKHIVVRVFIVRWTPAYESDSNTPESALSDDPIEANTIPRKMGASRRS